MKGNHQRAGSLKPAAPVELYVWTINPSLNKSAGGTLMEFYPVQELKVLHAENCCLIRSRWIRLFHHPHCGACTGIKLLSSVSPTPMEQFRASVLTRWYIFWVEVGRGLPAAHTSADRSSMNFHSNPILNGLKTSSHPITGAQTLGFVHIHGSVRWKEKEGGTHEQFTTTWHHLNRGRNQYSSQNNRG